VQSGAHPLALKKLNDTGVVVITGPPRVGKSTLANLPDPNQSARKVRSQNSAATPLIRGNNSSAMAGKFPY
jgi:putative ribosome biogenesis GTPase RsgA